LDVGLKIVGGASLMHLRSRAPFSAGERRWWREELACGHDVMLDMPNELTALLVRRTKSAVGEEGGIVSTPHASIGKAPPSGSNRMTASGTSAKCGLGA